MAETKQWTYGRIAWAMLIAAPSFFFGSLFWQYVNTDKVTEEVQIQQNKYGEERLPDEQIKRIVEIYRLYT